MAVDIDQLEGAGVADAQTACGIADREAWLRRGGAELHFEAVGRVGCLAWIHVITQLEHFIGSATGSLVAAGVSRFNDFRISY